MKKLDLNITKDLIALKESLNNVIDKKIAEQSLSEKLNSIKHLSFGEYKTLFENIMPDLANTVNGHKVIASYVKLLKENAAINSIYRVLQGFGLNESTDKNVAPYVLTDILENIDRNILKEGEQKMYKIYTDACKISGNVTCESIDNILNENKSLNDAISYLTHKSNKADVKLLNERVSSIKVLSDFVNENTVSKNVETNTDKTNSELMSELNELFEGVENEWEHNVLKDIALCYMSGGNAEQLFEDYKAKCIETIDNIESDDVVERSRLHGMKQQLSEKQYHADTLSDDLFKLAELKETLLNEA